ncbi:MAG: polysaccharide deacetylase family protein [Oscillospiraceae bacterium]|nr:polysaccharide deacetylase family protein [Oscillospiraceae bacterium]
MNKRFLIINADDFGLYESSDRAIETLFDGGLITSSTILAPASNARQACEVAKQKNYAVGVHWTLHSEWADAPWRPCAKAGQVPSLADGQGYLWSGGKQVRKHAKGADVTRELQAQVDFLRQCGCDADHADSHGGTLYGINGRLFFINAFRVCRELGLPFRFPKTDGFLRRQFGGRVPAVVKGIHRGIAALGQKMGVKLLDDFITNPYHIAKIPDYESLSRYYEEQLATAPAGVTEVFLHPSLPDGELCAKTAEWKKREWEYRFLSEGRLLEAAKKEGFALVSWEVFS